ncbi:MAG: hypothetical protein OHK0029_39710 [Armatimonadaceae bacterium]
MITLLRSPVIGEALSIPVISSGWSDDALFRQIPKVIRKHRDWWASRPNSLNNFHKVDLRATNRPKSPFADQIAAVLDASHSITKAQLAQVIEWELLRRRENVTANQDLFPVAFLDVSRKSVTKAVKEYCRREQIKIR